MGQMSPLACDASIDFARFANEHGCTLYFWEFLKHGFQALPDNLQQRYEGLKHWNGVGSLKHDLRRLASGSLETKTLLSGRSATLMKFAAKLLTGPCRNVLITDTCWPAYRNIMQREFEKCGCQISQISIQHNLLRESIPSEDVVSLLADEFARNNCDGLFLPLVDNLGVCLPIERIVRRIQKQCELRFVVVDGAQALGHIPLALDRNYCDLLIAGSHKWLRAFHSMGIGFYSNSGTKEYIANSLNRWTESGELDDPLIPFVSELTTGEQRLFGETVQVAPLISASAAAKDALLAGHAESEGVVDLIQAVSGATGWHLVSAQNDMTSRISLFQPATKSTRWDPDAIRSQLLKANIAATVYLNRTIRLSLPRQGLAPADQLLLQRGLRSLVSELGC